MPLDALVKQGDEWLPLADIKHELITTAQDNGKDYAVFEGAYSMHQPRAFIKSHTHAQP
jgi:hypothetical protein